MINDIIIENKKASKMLEQNNSELIDISKNSDVELKVSNVKENDVNDNKNSGKVI